MELESSTDISALQTLTTLLYCPPMVTMCYKPDRRKLCSCVQTESDEAMFIIRNASIVSLDHNWIMASIASLAGCTHSASISSFRGGRLAIFCHYLWYNMSALHQLWRLLENFALSGLGYKIIRSLVVPHSFTLTLARSVRRLIIYCH